MIDKLKHFFLIKLWEKDLTKMNKWQAFLFRQGRILFVAGKGFLENRIQEKASALTFYTLLSIVPVIAMVFGIAKGFGFQERLHNIVLENTTNNREVWMKVVDFAESMLDNTQGGLIAGIGVVVLIWSVMRLLISIEDAFNDVWEIMSGRSWSRKFTDYLTIMILSPILLLLSSSATVYIKSQFETLADQFEIIGFFGPLVHFLFKLSPYILIWLAFTLLYTVMPNTRVNIKSAIIAAIIAGTGFQLFEWAYITLQVGVSRYNAIYGSFAALPLFLIWLQTSWLIVMVGAELAFANENVEQYEHENEMGEVSIEFTKKITVLVMHKIIHRFMFGEKPVTEEELANELGIPVRMVRQILSKLRRADFIAQTPTKDDKTRAYLPKRDIHNLKLTDLSTAIEELGASGFPVKDKKVFEEIDNHFETLQSHMEHSNENVLIKNINVNS
jgi:membrane protein